jgi:tetratricopeptide (TPR) repeat protein
VNARERWQALQARLTAAQAFETAGDRKSALREVEAALALDPNFLAAHSLRERLLGQPARPIPPPPPVPGGTALDADPGAGYARFEQRARRRRVDRKIESARTAIARGRLKEAATALDEIIELDPNLPELAPLTAQFDDLRRGTHERHNGPLFVAAAAFAAIVLGATWIEHTRPNLLARSSTAVAELVEPAPPQPVASEPIEAETPAPPEPSPSVVAAAATTGVRESESARPAFVERDRPVRNAEPRTEATIPPVVGSLDATLGPRPLAAPPAPEPANATVSAPAMPPQTRQTSEPIVILPVAPPPTAPAASAVPAAIVRSANDEQLVRQALQRYRSAYEGLDAPSARAVYPAVNEAALARAFDGLASQTLTFDSCDVQMRGDAASAICHGTARYVPKVGSREPRTEPRRWSFTLQRNGADWKIESARAER